jgi:hypothetical protein
MLNYSFIKLSFRSSLPSNLIYLLLDSWSFFYNSHPFFPLAFQSLFHVKSFIYQTIVLFYSAFQSYIIIQIIIIGGCPMYELFAQYVLNHNNSSMLHHQCKRFKQKHACMFTLRLLSFWPLHWLLGCNKSLAVSGYSLHGNCTPSYNFIDHSTSQWASGIRSMCLGIIDVGKLCRVWEIACILSLRLHSLHTGLYISIAVGRDIPISRDAHSLPKNKSIIVDVAGGSLRSRSLYPIHAILQSCSSWYSFSCLIRHPLTKWTYVMGN